MKKVNVVEKEVSQKEEQKLKKEQKYVLISTNKVTYQIKTEQECILHQEKYANFFKMLEKAEKMLKRKLLFNIQISFMTLDAFSGYQTEEELNSLLDIMGVRIFELIQDISLRKDIYKSEQIRSRYIYNSSLRKLREYYDKNNRVVIYSILHGYTSLYLFDLFQNDASYYKLINNICSIIKRKNNTIRKKAASIIYIEFMNKQHLLNNEKEIEKLYRQIYAINEKILNLTNDDIRFLYEISIDEMFQV